MGPSGAPLTPSAPGDTLSATLEAIVARYAAKVRWVARDCRLDPGEVGDLVQDLRIRLWRVIERGERIASEKPSYVHRMVMSAAVDLIRPTSNRHRRRRPCSGRSGLEPRHVPQSVHDLPGPGVPFLHLGHRAAVPRDGQGDRHVRQ
jgi:DNA-directed RNA polymerase specialized sigma24 family protein